MILNHNFIKWIVASIFGVLVWTVPSMSAVLKLSDLPNGIIDGLPDTKNGVYFSAVAPKARVYQNRLILIENKIHGLSILTNKPVPYQSEAGFILEFELIKLHQDIANASELSTFEKESFLLQTIRLYQDVRTHAERIFENAIRYIK